MSVAGDDNDGSTVFVLQKLFSRASLQSGGGDSDSKDVNYGIIGSSSVTVLIVLCVFICLCRRRRKRRRFKKGRVISTSTLTTSSPTVYNIPTKVLVEPVELRTTEDVTRRYQRSISNLSGRNPGKYLVPISVLPPDFDYSSKEVEFNNDFVILKDLSLLERHSSPTPNGNGVVNAAYEPQEAYNPNTSNGSIPSSLTSERYQRQAPYNPTFY